MQFFLVLSAVNGVFSCTFLGYFFVKNHKFFHALSKLKRAWLRPIPARCVKGLLVGHCVDFFRGKSCKKLSMPQNAKVNTHFANMSKMKHSFQLFICCAFPLCIDFAAENPFPKRHVMTLNKIGALRQQQISSVEIVIVMKP